MSYNGIGRYPLSGIARRRDRFRAAPPSRRDQGRGINRIPNEPIFPPNPNKMKPLAPSIDEPARTPSGALPDRPGIGQPARSPALPTIGGIHREARH